MLIKIVCGTYGYRDKNGILRPKNNLSEPFELETDRAQYLIAQGIAVAAGTAGVQLNAYPDVEQLTDMNKSELVKIAEEMGLPAQGKKEEIIARIVEAGNTEVTDIEDIPVLKAAEPEV